MHFSEIRSRLRTVISIPVTPFQDSDRAEIDWKGFRSNLERQMEGGIAALTPNGNTSEFFSLGRAETDRVCREALDIGMGRALVMPGIGYDLETASAMARHAVRAGAPAVMVHEPVHPFMGQAGWVAYHRQIADAVPDTAVVCYLRHAGIGTRELLQVAEACPNFVGVKYAVPDAVAFAETAHALEGSGLVLICGVAETWAPFFWPAGAQGFTSGLVNVTLDPSLQLFHALQAGNKAAAMAAWNRIRPFERMRTQDRSALNVSVVKEAMCQMGYASRRVRPPLAPVAPEQRSQIARMLTDFGLGTPDLKIPPQGSPGRRTIAL